jgi:hypothetical protein
MGGCSSAYEAGYTAGHVIWIGIIALGVYLAWNNATWETRFVRALDAGNRQKARQLLDRNAKKKKPRSLPGYRQMMQRSRYIGLWLLGELDTIRAEIAGHAGNGSPGYIANVEMFGVLALAAEAAEPAPHADQLEVLAAAVKRDSTRLAKHTIALADTIAVAGRALAGGPFAEAQAAAFLEVSWGGRLSRILKLRVLVLVAQRSGRPGLRFQRQLAALTKRFAEPPPAA